MRPIGAWILGWYADRRGRRAALIASVTLMCSGSLLIALAPGFDRIGLLAPALLILARVLQGLSVGGEYGASATYLTELAGSRQRGFFASFQYVTIIMGQLLALAVLVILQRVFLSEQQLHAWGWRIPFALGALCAVIVAALRRGMDETDAFRKITSAGTTAGRDRRGDVRSLLKYWREVLTVFGLTLGGTVNFYTFTVYSQKFLVNTSGFDNRTAATVCALAMLAFMLAQAPMGYLSDVIGRRRVFLGFGVLGTVLAVPLLHALASATSAAQAFFLLLAALLIVSGYTSINAVVKAELFPTEIRALGVALPYAIAVALFAGTVESVALWMKQAGHESAFYWYVAACTSVSLAVYWLMPETRDRQIQ